MKPSKQSEVHALFKKHPRMTVNAISKRYNLPYATLWRHYQTWLELTDENPLLRMERVSRVKREANEDGKFVIQQPSDYVIEKMQEQCDSDVTKAQLESNRLMFVAGTLFGVVLTMGFYLLNQAGV